MTTPRLDNTLTYSNGTSGGVENQAFYTKALPAGDFVTEVDFECLSLPRPTGQNRNELFLRATVNGVGFRVARWEANSGGSYFFQRYPGGKIYTASTKDTSGRLRLRRVSDTVFGEFWRDGGWVKVSSADGASGPAYRDLGLLSTGGDQLDVKFSNFTLKATTVSFDLSPDDWSAENLSQSPVYDAGGVTLKKTGPAGNQWIVSAFPLGSDNFTVSVDYEAKQFPAPADKGTRNDILFSAELGNQQYTLAYVTDKYGQHYRYQAWPANPTAFVPAPGTPSGRLRLRRDKNKLWAETWNNGTWATLGSIDIPAKVPAYIRLGTFSDTGQRLEVRFSNLQVE